MLTKYQKKKIFVYIVNLKKDKKRKKHILYELKKQNIKNYKIVEAVNGYNFKFKELKSKTYTDKKGFNKWNIGMSPGQIGCALSHLKIYKIFLKSNYDIALILEDDAVFKKNLSNFLLNLISKNFGNYKQITLLSELKQFYIKPIDKYKNYELVNVTNAFFTHAYFINKEAAKSIISFNYPVKTIADNFIFFKIYCGVKITGLNPFLVYQDYKNQKINIRTEVKNDKKNKKKKIFLIKFKLYKYKIKILKFFNFFNTHFKKF